MDAGGEREGPRRSTRIRKETSHAVLEESPEDPNFPESGESEAVEDFHPKHRRRPQKTSVRSKTTDEVYKPIVSEKSNAPSHSRDSRIISISGTDENVQAAMLDRMRKWKDVLEHIPENLLDYTIGWGVASGDWNGKGGGRQKYDILQKFVSLVLLLILEA